MCTPDPERDPSTEGTLPDALMRGVAESASALCFCDAQDRIRYANPRFRAAFFPHFDGGPADFMDTMVAAGEAGTGLRVVSATPDAFAREHRRSRLALVGSRSFSTDTADGGWWSITDTKLSNGWIMVVAQDITGLKREEAKLRDAHHSALVESQTDHLTGAPNRRHGLRRAEALWKVARAADHPLCVALLDVDHFKAINDAYGHEAGDRALVHLCRNMMASVRPGDVFSRLGGDEFLLVRARAEARALDADLASALAAIQPLDLGDGEDPLRLSISVGVAQARPDESWPGLMHRADMALYAAKAGGRNRVALAG